MKCRSYVMLFPLIMTGATVAAAAQPTLVGQATAPLSTLDAKARQEIVAKLGEALRQRYVFPDVGARAAAKIEAARAGGEYERLADPAMFGTRLLADVQTIAHDKHLRIWTNGAPPPPGAPAATPIPPAEGGISRADRLAGGVGYIEVIGFPAPPLFKQAVDRAMSSLVGSRALIIDVRRNGGGAAPAATYLASFLVAPDLPLNAIVTRVENRNEFARQDFRSVATPVSFASVPVYILVSKDTFSAGEAFAYDVQALKRGTVIGEVTGGGANPTQLVGLVHGFVATIPFARAENPTTGTNWEGRGVQPDMPVAAADALAIALGRAGQKPVSEIAVASIQQVFTPQAMPRRSTPLPGSETALRTVLAGLASGKPDYASMPPELAGMIRQVLPEMQAQLSQLGELRSMTFRGPDMMGGDEYELHFAKGDRMMALVVGPDGKILAMSAMIPLPPKQ